MQKRSLLYAAALTTLLSATAAAQNAPPAPSAPETTGSVGASTFYTVQEGRDLLSRNLVGSKVTNPQNETVGDISDIVFDSSGKAKAVILSVGGFLGIGDRHVAVNYDALKINRDSSGNVTASLNTSKDQLKSAPEFNYLAKDTGPGLPARP